MTAANTAQNVSNLTAVSASPAREVLKGNTPKAARDPQLLAQNVRTLFSRVGFPMTAEQSTALDLLTQKDPEGVLSTLRAGRASGLSARQIVPVIAELLDYCTPKASAPDLLANPAGRERYDASPNNPDAAVRFTLRSASGDSLCNAAQALKLAA